MGAIVIVEIGRKQNYIFSSNKMKEIIGASMIIRYISEELPRKIKHVDNTCFVKDDTIVATGGGQIIIEGGGHSIYHFYEEKSAKAFISALSYTVQKEFPGIDLWCTSINYDEQSDILKDKIDELFKKLSAKKSGASHTRNLTQYSYGIERLCESTQQAASSLINNRFVSDEIKSKLDFANPAKTKEYFKNLYNPEKADMVSDIDQFDDYGNKIAVVHMDGNQLGVKLQMFSEVMQPLATESIPQFNERYLNAYRIFSQEIDHAFKLAFRNMLDQLSVQLNQSTEEFEQAKKLVFRPIIFAGDDVSFLIPGSLGVTAAKHMLLNLQNNPINIPYLDETGTQKQLSFTLHACAGIAIVNNGYPFSKAHQLAEELCSSAKSRVLQDRRIEDQLVDKAHQQVLEDASALDFHILHGDWNDSIYDLRDQEYAHEDYRLTMKPYYVLDESCLKQLVVSSNYHNQLTTFEEALYQIKYSGIARSKVKKMREMLKKGPAEAKKYALLNQLFDALNKGKDTNKNGVRFKYAPMPIEELFAYYEVNYYDAYSDGKAVKNKYYWTPYYDAIEAMDIFNLENSKEAN